MNKPPLILVVDDEIHILHVVTLKLERAGYRVLTAEDGEEALAVARRESPDAVLTDYQMPFMTGMDLARALRESAQTADTPVVVLTARGFSLPASQMEQAGISGVISKPFSPREVLERVTALVGPAEPSKTEELLNP